MMGELDKEIFMFRRKAHLRGMEKLLGMGGFIEDYIIEEIQETYSEEVIEAVMKYCPVNSGLWDVLDATEEAFNETEVIAAFAIHKTGVSATEYAEWYIEQTSRLASLLFVDDTQEIWMDRELSRKHRDVLMQLSILKARIYCLAEGLDGGKKRSFQEIAQLPEFQCKPEYIEQVICEIESNLKTKKSTERIQK